MTHPFHLFIVPVFFEMYCWFDSRDVNQILMWGQFPPNITSFLFPLSYSISSPPPPVPHSPLLKARIRGITRGDIFLVQTLVGEFQSILDDKRNMFYYVEKVYRMHNA